MPTGRVKFGLRSQWKDADWPCEREEMGAECGPETEEVNGCKRK